MAHTLSVPAACSRWCPSLHTQRSLSYVPSSQCRGSSTIEGGAGCKRLCWCRGCTILYIIPSSYIQIPQRVESAFRPETSSASDSCGSLTQVRVHVMWWSGLLNGIASLEPCGRSGGGADMGGEDSLPIFLGLRRRESFQGWLTPALLSERAVSHIS